MDYNTEPNMEPQREPQSEPQIVPYTEQVTKLSSSEKIKYFILAFVPAIVIVMLQSFVSTIIVFYKFLLNLDNTSVLQNPDYIISEVMKTTSESVVPILAVYLSISFIIELFVAKGTFKWKFSFAKLKPVKAADYIAVMLISTGAMLILELLLDRAFTLLPKVAKQYASLIESMGITDFTPLTILLSVVLAPIVEEIALRGFTMQLFKKAVGKFWIANILQALIFGFMHGNIVQGVYAFFLGLSFGYVCNKYDSVLMSMLAHMTFNFIGSLGVALLVGLFGNGIGALFIYAAIGVAFIVCAIVLLKKYGKDAVKAD